MLENPLASQILHAVSIPHDDHMVNVHVCILALSQVTLSLRHVCYAMVLLFSLELLGHGLVCTPPCLPPSLAANPFLLSAVMELCAMSKANLL